MIRLIAVAGFGFGFTFAVATSAEAMIPAPIHQPDGLMTQVAYGDGRSDGARHGNAPPEKRVTRWRSRVLDLEPEVTRPER